MVSWKIRTGPRASLRLERLPVQPERGQGETHPRAFADVICNPETSLRTNMPGPAAHAPDSITDSHSKPVHIGGLPYQADTVTLDKKAGEYLNHQKVIPVHSTLS